MRLASLLTIVSFAFFAKSAAAQEHPHHHLHHALWELRDARKELKEAKHDFGGHREKAIVAIDDAIKNLDLCPEKRWRQHQGAASLTRGDLKEVYKTYKHDPHLSRGTLVQTASTPIPATRRIQMGVRRPPQSRRPRRASRHRADRIVPQAPQGLTPENLTHRMARITRMGKTATSFSHVRIPVRYPCYPWLKCLSKIATWSCCEKWSPCWRCVCLVVKRQNRDWRKCNHGVELG